MKLTVSVTALALSGLLLGACAADNGADVRSSGTTAAAALSSEAAVAETTAVTAANTTTATTTTVAPTTTLSVADFYATPNPLPSGGPGTVVRSEPIDPIPGATRQRILYLSQGAVVSGLLYVPTRPAPAGGRVIVSWAHGTTGSADACAPSRNPDLYPAPGLSDLLSAGYVVVATDYPGLGTAGLHPYLYGTSEGESVLDAARAARSLAGASNRLLIWGHSQGGQAAVWAGQLAHSYAPELTVLGVAAAAPASQLAALTRLGATTPSLAWAWVPAFAGFASLHPELRLSDVMKPATIALLPKLETQCGSALGTTFSAIAGGPGTTDPLKLPDWGSFVRSNDAGQAAIGAPLLVLQGDKDGTVPKSINDGYTADACKQRDTVQYSVWPGDSHESIVKGHALEEAIGWMVDRVAGRTAPSNCAAVK